jgi:hypothetical protein
MINQLLVIQFAVPGGVGAYQVISSKFTSNFTSKSLRSTDLPHRPVATLCSTGLIGTYKHTNEQTNKQTNIGNHRFRDLHYRVRQMMNKLPPGEKFACALLG